MLIQTKYIYNKPYRNFLFYLIIIPFLYLSCNGGIPSCDNCNFTCLEGSEQDVITEECKSNWVCEFEIFSDKKINLDNEFRLEDGNRKVFHMRTSTEGDIDLFDDEIDEILIFELGESTENFSVEGEEMKKIKLHFRVFCFCQDISFQEVTIGCIQGELQDNDKWRVQGNLTIPYEDFDYEIKLDAHFSR